MKSYKLISKYAFTDIFKYQRIILLEFGLKSLLAYQMKSYNRNLSAFPLLNIIINCAQPLVSGDVVKVGFRTWSILVTYNLCLQLCCINIIKFVLKN